MVPSQFQLAGRITLVFAAAMAGLVVAAAAGQAPKITAPGHRQPVLVELFTSEGCSDCPPADLLLAKVDAEQAAPGAQVIVLSEHVTYWNHLGWRDPFSFEEMDERQQRYGAHFALSSIYTPQIVVDGSAQLVGSDAVSLGRAVATAAASNKEDLAINDARWEGGGVRFQVAGDVDAHATLVAALAEDATRSEVGRGENAGRTLHHVAVVRVLKAFDWSAINGTPVRLTAAVLSRDSQHSPVRLVVFLADRKTGQVRAVAEQRLTR